MNKINGIGYVYGNSDKRQNPNATPQEAPEKKVEQEALETNLAEAPSCVYGKALIKESKKPEWLDSVNEAIKVFQNNPKAVEMYNENYEEAAEVLGAEGALALLDNLDTVKYAAHV